MSCRDIRRMSAAVLCGPRKTHDYVSRAICGDGAGGQDLGLEWALDQATDVDSGTSTRPHKAGWNERDEEGGEVCV